MVKVGRIYILGADAEYELCHISVILCQYIMDLEDDLDLRARIWILYLRALCSSVNMKALSIALDNTHIDEIK